MEDLPYTKSIINKIINKIEETEINQENFSTEFKEGAKHAKQQIILKIKETKF